MPRQSPIRTPANLVTAARAKPDQISHGMAGVGTIVQIAQERFDAAAKIQIKHIPCRRTAPAVAPGYEAGLWVGMWVAAGTPPAITQRYNRELVEIVRNKELAEQLQAHGAGPLAWTPQRVGARVRRDYVAFSKLATDKNIVME